MRVDKNPVVIQSQPNHSAAHCWSEPREQQRTKLQPRRQGNTLAQVDRNAVYQLRIERRWNKLSQVSACSQASRVLEIARGYTGHLHRCMPVWEDTQPTPFHDGLGRGCWMVGLGFCAADGERCRSLSLVSPKQPQIRGSGSFNCIFNMSPTLERQKTTMFFSCRVFLIPLARSKIRWRRTTANET